jgi:c(7)-type cytochrome triheme protein
MNLRLPKLTFWNILLVILCTMGAYAAYTRFFYGLGAATHLSDQFPWGIWIGFDILVGVGLAAGGFVICATVYIFDLKNYKSIQRSTVLTAFLGYLLVISALLFDLGKPWNVWHPIIMWNPHSVMFEVGWCVMLYTTVLFLEFLPILFERFRLERPLRILHSITIPIVILGVLLSTLHQSSLGTLYVIVPEKLHPLWYTSWLPVLFFISAVAGGLAMVIFESYLSARAFKKSLEFSILVKLSRVIVVVLAIWLVLRFQALGSRGALSYILDGSKESIFFLVEVGLGAVLPIILFLIPAVRNSKGGLYLSAVFVLIGFVMNRLNVAVTGMARSSGVDYVPSWMEVAVTATIVAVGLIIFRYAAKFLPIFSSDEEETHEAIPPLIAAGRSGSIAMIILSVMLLVIVISLGFGLAREKTTAVAIEPPTLMPATEPLKMPADFSYRSSESSPGVVTFSHLSHVDSNQPNCKGCHTQFFSIRPAIVGASRPASGEMHEKNRCGACHDGEKAFNLSENCETCHVAAK